MAGIDALFHEDAFLTAGEIFCLVCFPSVILKSSLLATAEFYVTGPHTATLMDEITSVQSMSTDFLNNSLAMRKRMYFIMVELAVIHEQFRSSLIRRQQLIEEGEFIGEKLRSHPDNATGVDALVP